MGVQKPRKDPATGLSPSNRYPLLEEQLVNLYLEAMNEVEVALEGGAGNPEPDSNISLLWWNLSSELIFFLLYQFISFPSFVDSIHKALNQGQKMREGRDFLMWSLLQFISGSIAKNPYTDFMPVLKLFSLYDEPTPLPIPSGKNAVRKLAAAAIYIHLSRKMARNEESGVNLFPFALPIALKGHYDYLKSLVESNDDLDVANSVKNDFKVAILCNTFSTAQEFFQVIISDLIKAISGGSNNSDTPSESLIPMPSPNIQVNFTC